MRSDANARRAAFAADALEVFRERVGDDDDRTTMLDLITDLGHLARHSGIDFVELVAQAVSVWVYERRHPDGTGASPQVIITVGGRRPKLAWPGKGGEP